MVDQVAIVEPAAMKTIADLVSQEAVVEQGQVESSARDAAATSGRAVVAASPPEELWRLPPPWEKCMWLTNTRW